MKSLLDVRAGPADHPDGEEEVVVEELLRNVLDGRHTVGLLYSSKETLKGSRLIIACLGRGCKHSFFGGACVIISS